MFLRVLSSLFLVLLAWGGERDSFVSLPVEAQLEVLKNAPPEEQLELLRALKAEIETDPLTGLRNRRSLRQLRAAADQVAFISFDLDHFKRINDTYGHDVGDRVLAKVAEVARANVRDPVFRLGGEEFLVILQGVPVEAAAVVAERLRGAIAGATIEGHPGLRFTGSFGVAAGSIESALMWDALLKASDEASYQAKAGGRNQVVVAPAGRACEILARKQ